MGVIVDASFIFPLLAKEENSDKVSAALAQLDEIIDLDFTLIEISNALTSSVCRKRISAQFANEAQFQFRALAQNTILTQQFLQEAFELTLQINHPVYHCLYAIVARENNATPVTCDARFAAKLDHSLIKTLVI